ncbi:MAG TPA: CoA-binding protein, partial [Fimbriiglobus sp.]|nr:CoA-binding protein [Fimbriiglobus sp.]
VYKSVSDIPRATLDRVTVYLPPAVGMRVLDEFAGRPVGEVYLNPGADAPEVVAKAKQLGLNVVIGCSILAVGAQPDQFPDE